jgi:hypothetical protein
VTEILRDVGLINFDGVDADTLEWARTRGEYIHEATRLLDEGNLAAPPSWLEPYLTAWELFKKETQFTPKLIEFIGYSNIYGVAGKIDRGGYFGNWAAVVDIKPPSKKSWWRYQTVAYAIIFYPEIIPQRICVSLLDDGKYRLDEHKDFFEDRRRFLGCKTVYDLKRENRLVGEGLDSPRVAETAL